jgi:predicted SnoaL-like aldol condensation-catalyzing enzyme
MNSANEKNTRLVLEAFGALFNKRDYAAAEKFWSPHYIQHSAHIGPGAKDCSISSRASHRPSDTSQGLSWRRASS